MAVNLKLIRAHQMQLRWLFGMAVPFSPYDFILDAAGVRIEDPQPGESEEVKEDKPKRRRRGYAEYSLDDLNAMLDKVIGEEDYEKAAKIRDEINRRKEEEKS
jgi:excinuclease UvrABC helicase subunit UvrB